MKDIPQYIQNNYPKKKLFTARDYSKEKIGMLTPLYRTNDKGKSIMWLTQCDCGEYEAVRAFNLNNKSITSCKACAIKNYKTWRQDNVPQWVVDKYPEIPIGRAAERHGDKFGRLTALYRTEPNHEPHWLCKCDCGNYEVVSLHYLVNRLKGTCDVCYGKLLNIR